MQSILSFGFMSKMVKLLKKYEPLISALIARSLSAVCQGRRILAGDADAAEMMDGRSFAGGHLTESRAV